MAITRSPRAHPTALAAAPAVAAVLLLGVWVAGGVISDDFRTSMALTAVWFALAAAACLLVARRRRSLRIPVIVAYLAATTLRDDVVHEQVIMATSVAPAPDDGGVPRGPVEVARGRFRSHEH